MNTQNYLDEMNTKNYLDEMKKIQGSLLQFLESQNNSEENYQLLFNLIGEQKILDSKYKFTSFLHLISKVSNNHYRDSDFFNKIDHILKQVNGSIAKYLTNTQTFNIFKGNKRVLLYLIEEKIIIIDQYISKKFFTKKFISCNYTPYFAPEIRPFLNKLFPQCLQHNKELPKDFYELRKIGENETEIWPF